MHLPIMVSYLSGGPSLFPSKPSVAMAGTLQAVFLSNPVPFPGTELRSLSFSTQLHPHWQRTISVWGAQGGGADPLFKLLSVLPSTNWWLLSPPSSQIPLPVRSLPKVREHFLLHISLPVAQVLSWFLLFIFPFVLLGYVEPFLPFWKAEVFCWCSVAVLCESFQL